MRKKIALGSLVIGLICSVTLVFILLGAQPYFMNFKTTDSVKAHILKSLHMNKSSFQDVQKVIDNQLFGRLDCITQQNPKMISCLALNEQFNWWYYLLNFTFDNDLLIEFEVYKTYRGL